MLIQRSTHIVIRLVGLSLTVLLLENGIRAFLELAWAAPEYLSYWQFWVYKDVGNQGNVVAVFSLAVVPEIGRASCRERV